ncbi:cbb3-type cytochrome oxidase assembly protein CcoS [Amorphus orientalis]|uniref:Cbb3-type cytochrome oxidase maturation protein n=1 Tax=Amorphus orientalis TaxID=649198 RepID=A0AAE3VQ97_9HYPH|nr:cbb3-type cytochrome oxidase assembly protein CcoS [Amorphus orientalis]MDQ0316171.1 cbb3-type cytochrome oxidase maturation protein [Amorphus orientalis]
MNILLILVPAALFLGLIGLAAFLWSLRSGQYDDLEGAKWRILTDDDLGRDGDPGDETSDDRRQS